MSGQRVVLTYGTFDLFHVGHLRLLERLKALGDYLVVGVSSDEFNASKGKRTIIRYEDRAAIVGAVKPVDLVIPETTWEQKPHDIEKYGVAVLGMGHDWQGKFDDLRAHCEVTYLPRTEGISSSQIKSLLSPLDANHVEDLKQALDVISSIVRGLE
jgi:glycerol-3-phosphate cytidylyltransferase